MAETGMFKTAFRGFRKEDVLAYIDGALAQRSEQEEALQQRVEELEQQLAEAQVQQEAVRENEQLAARVRELLVQVEELTGQLAETTTQLNEATAQLEEARSASKEASAQEEELSAQLEQSHQAVAALWEEKATLEKQLAETGELTERLKAISEDFCRQVSEMLPATEDTGKAPAAPVLPDQPPILIETSEPKPMERWLF